MSFPPLPGLLPSFRLLSLLYRSTRVSTSLPPFPFAFAYNTPSRTMIGIGFSTRTVALSRPPGWEPESWGYHGDDGHCFAAQNIGKSYGPKFGPGDTVGCLVNFRLGQALFTKNGEQLCM